MHRGESTEQGRGGQTTHTETTHTHATQRGEDTATRCARRAPIRMDTATWIPIQPHQQKYITELARGPL